MFQSKAAEQCPDCGRPLQTVWDYPSNELWCVHCGNRYFANLGPAPVSRDPLGGFRILLLDTISERRDRIIRSLTRLAYQVTPVCHPRQALEAATFRRFDVTVMPASLPEYESCQFVNKLKGLLGTVKFVLFSDGPCAPATFQDADVVWVTAGAGEVHDLEQTVESLVDELMAIRMSRCPDPDLSELVGTS